jgi:hypothetical protein
MLLAKISADFQDYQTMLSASQAIVESGVFSLHPDYYSLFNYDGQFSDESILELVHTDFGASSGDATNIDQFYVAHGIKQTGGTKYDGTAFTGAGDFPCRHRNS